MNKYKVRVYIDYEIDAKNEGCAADIAEKQFIEELENNHFGLTEIFNFDVVEIKGSLT